jgi:hypothetical protein
MSLLALRKAVKLTIKRLYSSSTTNKFMNSVAVAFASSLLSGRVDKMIRLHIYFSPIKYDVFSFYLTLSCKYRSGQSSLVVPLGKFFIYLIFCLK